MADGCSIADAGFRCQFPCARYRTVPSSMPCCNGTAKHGTAVPLWRSGWAGRHGRSLILSLAPAVRWRWDPQLLGWLAWQAWL